jgi:hypothetical protein
MTEVAINFGRKQLLIDFGKKNCLGYILGDFLTNSSHPVTLCMWPKKTPARHLQVNPESTQCRTYKKVFLIASDANNPVRGKTNLPTTG